MAGRAAVGAGVDGGAGGNAAKDGLGGRRCRGNGVAVGAGTAVGDGSGVGVGPPEEVIALGGATVGGLEGMATMVGAGDEGSEAGEASSAVPPGVARATAPVVRSGADGTGGEVPVAGICSLLQARSPGSAKRKTNTVQTREWSAPRKEPVVLLLLNNRRTSTLACLNPGTGPVPGEWRGNF